MGLTKKANVKEWTKGVTIPCRDCGEILSILTTESANILDARCPKCHKEFQKKGEEFNLKIGYTAQGEAPSLLMLSGMADNGSFGLEFLYQGIWDEKVKNLLLYGIAFCENILKDKDDETAKKIKNELETILKEKGKRVPGAAQIRAMQAFFNTESAPMLRNAMQNLRKRRYRW